MPAGPCTPHFAYNNAHGGGVFDARRAECRDAYGGMSLHVVFN